MPSNKNIVRLSVSYTNNPGAGAAIDFLCDDVVLGSNTPLLLLVISRIELAFGVVVPIPVEPVCDKTQVDIRMMQERINNLFIIHDYCAEIIVGWIQSPNH